MAARMTSRELIESAARSLFGAVSYIGTLLNKGVFEHRSRVKQHRLEAFVTAISDRISQLDESVIRKDYLRSEDFVDFFESILLRVMRTWSEEKLNRFRDIFVRQIENPRETDFTETFLDIILRLEDLQIRILKEHHKFKRVIHQFEPGQPTSSATLAAFWRAEHYGLDLARYRFLVQGLISEGLMYDDSINRLGTKPFEITEITVLGERFLDFLGGDGR